MAKRTQSRAAGRTKQAARPAKRKNFLAETALTLGAIQSARDLGLGRALTRKTNPRPIFTAAQDAELVNLYHLARTALSGKSDSRYDRMIWASNEFGKAHPEIGANWAYKHISGGLLDQGYRRNPEDIDFLNDLAPSTSLGHLEFTPDGIERYVRDGYVYRAFSNTQVFEDGYRMGSVEGEVGEGEVGELQSTTANPRKKRNFFDPVTALTAAQAVHSLGWHKPIVRGYHALKEKFATTNGDHGLAWAGWELAFNGTPSYIAVEFQGSIPPRVITGNDEGILNEISDTDNGWVLLQLIDADGTYQAVQGSDYVIGRDGSRFENFGKQNPRRRRANPGPASDAVYEEFHGTAPSETLEIVEDFHVHGNLAGLGDLVHIVVELAAGTKEGKQLQLNAPDPAKASDSDIVRLTSNEDKSQLYFTGGDQQLDLQSLGFRKSFDIVHDGEHYDATDIKDLMVIGPIVRVMYRTEKAFDDFEQIDYHHLHGEDTKKYPTLLYDTLNDRMLTAGGEYAISPAGIVN